MATLFLDVDGPLAGLIPALCRAHGVDAARYPRGTWDLTVALGKPLADVWEPTRSEAFWADLPLEPWANFLYGWLCARFGVGEVCLLTQPTRDPSCVAGKARWIGRHFPQAPWFVGPKKVTLSRPGLFLVDDSAANVRQWRERGGSAVLFPAVCNPLHALAADPVPSVLDELRALLKGGARA